jgi:phosphoribosylaminoimidazole (AIR) synthetase
MLVGDVTVHGAEPVAIADYLCSPALEGRRPGGFQNTSSSRRM